MRLVNEFQRQHPLLCVPSEEPDHRFIHLGSPGQTLLLEELVVAVRARDPDPKPPPKFKLRVAEPDRATELP